MVNFSCPFFGGGDLLTLLLGDKWTELYQIAEYRRSLALIKVVLDFW